MKIYEYGKWTNCITWGIRYETMWLKGWIKRSSYITEAGCLRDFDYYLHGKWQMDPEKQSILAHEVA